ncbi:MAG: CIA30 family protein [Planctomycetota bacterium]
MNYRVVIGVFLLACLTVVADAKGRDLYRFDSPQAARQWRTVNDTVMGGRSIGRMKLVQNNRLMFSGTISKENNGGFAGVKTRAARPIGLKKGDVIVARVRGDGRQYLFNLMYASDIVGEGPFIKGRRRPEGFSYRQPFETKAGDWIEVRLPVDKSVTVWRGRQFPNENFDPGKVGGIRFLVKGEPGPFKLEVEWIKVVSPPRRGGKAVAN